MVTTKQGTNALVAEQVREAGKYLIEHAQDFACMPDSDEATQSVKITVRLAAWDEAPMITLEREIIPVAMCEVVHRC